MMQLMRDLSKSWIFKGLLSLLLVSFGIWGIGDMFRGNPMQRAVAEIGREKVTVQALEIEFQRSLPEVRKALGEGMSASHARQFGALDRALGYMIEQSLFRQEAKRLGIEIGDSFVLDSISAIPELRDENGNFDSRKWQQILSKMGMSERGYIEIQKENIARQIVMNAISANASFPEYMRDAVHAARGAKRILEIVTINDASMKEVPQATEAQVKEYYENNKESFMAPEYRSFTIAYLSASDSAAEKPSEEELKNAYESRSEELATPERRDLLQAAFQDEAEAKSFSDAAMAAKDMKAAAKEKNVKTLPMNNVDENTILPELYSTVFSLEEGQVSEPVKTPLGWQVFQLVKTHPAGKPSFEEAKESLAAELMREKSADSMAAMVNRLDDEIAAGNSLEDIADSLKLRLVKIPLVDYQGKDADDKPMEKIKAKDDVLSAAFGLGAGETGQVTDDKEGGYFVVRTDETAPSQALPFEKAAKKAAAGWLAQKQSEKAAEMAEKVAAALKEGKKSSAFAAKEGMEVRFSKPYTLIGDKDAEVPPSSLPEIFKMKKNDVITTFDSGRHYVLRLAEIVPVDSKNPGEGLSKVSEDLKDKFPLELLEQYSKHLRGRFPVKTNQDLLESLKGQGE